MAKRLAAELGGVDPEDHNIAGVAIDRYGTALTEATLAACIGYSSM